MNKLKGNPKGTLYLLALLLGLAFLFSIRFGAIHLSFNEMRHAVIHSIDQSSTLSLNENIFLYLRLPRALLCLLVGASLSVGGVLMQGLFRNPIIEPGLIGTSSGAAFGAALYLVLGASLQLHAGEWSLSVAASLGAIVATGLVLLLGNVKQAGRTSSIYLLLMGIGVNALFLSGVGFLAYIARDPQARSITFWNLGTLSGANWEAVNVLSIVFSLCLAAALRYAKQLNLLLLGEEEAYYLGTQINQLKLGVILLHVLLVASATAFVGVISFVGLISPHLLRLLHGSDHRYLIVGSALMGALLLTCADLAARLLLKPAELPIGIVTSLVGVPIFILLLRKRQLPSF